MNMISTGSFLTEMDASSKQQDLVKKLTRAWEKKNSKAARAGGVSLMALSLAACGSSEDDTPFSQADIDTAVGAVDITSDNDAAIAAAIAALPEDTTPFGQADLDSAVAAVDITSDNGPLIAAAEAAELVAAQALVDQAAAETTAAEALVAQAAAEDALAAVDITSDNQAAIDAAIAALPGRLQELAALPKHVRRSAHRRRGGGRARGVGR